MWALMSGMLRATYVSQVPRRFSLAVAEISHTKLLFAKLSMHVCVCVCMHVCMHVCMCVCM